MTLPPATRAHVFSFKIGATGEHDFQIDATLGQKSGTLQAAYTVPDLLEQRSGF